MRLTSEFHNGVPPDYTLARISKVFMNAGVVALPTDTVYGIGASVGGLGVRKIFSAKGRPAELALPVLVSDLGMATSLTEVGDGLGFARMRCLAEAFWPGALTLVVSRASTFKFDIGGSDASSVGLRIPGHEVARSIISAVGPIVVTSANLHGQSPIEISEEFFDPGNAELLQSLSGLVRDGTPGSKIASTVVDLRGKHIEILRQGELKANSLEAALVRQGLST